MGEESLFPYDGICHEHSGTPSPQCSNDGLNVMASSVLTSRFTVGSNPQRRKAQQ